MLLSTHRRTASVAVFALVTAGTLMTQTGTSAADPCKGALCRNQGGSGAQRGGQSILVWSSVVHFDYHNLPPGGSGVPARNAPAPYFPCGYTALYTGYTFAHDVWMKPEYMRHDDPEETPTTWPPEAEKDAHANDNGEGGMWNVPYCVLSQEGRDAYGEAGLDKIVNDWFDKTQDFLWVDAGTQPPAPPITVPPEVLAVLAYDELRVPDLHLHRSPEVGKPTYVNYNTWFWVDQGDLVSPISVTARAGDNRATAEVTTHELTIVATDSPKPTVCSPAQARRQGACYRSFTRSSAGRPGSAHRVTATARWTPTIETVPPIPPPPGLEDPIDVTADMDVPVAEIQSVVEESG